MTPMQTRFSSRVLVRTVLVALFVMFAAAAANAQTPVPTPGGNCCAAHEGPECDDATCEACVCDIDPLCCSATSVAGWDDFCVAHALDPKQCGAECPCITPTPTPGGDCCSPHAGGSCDNGPCRDCVCAIDGVCCSEEWDSTCVVIAGEDCVAMCPCGPAPTETPAPTPTPGGDCCTAHLGAQCDDDRCEQCVCGVDVDPECCTQEWDGRCVDEAAAECATECTCEATVSCCSTHEEVGCSDMRCQDCVCGHDATCCTEGWDEQCVSEAMKECATDCTCDTAGDCCEGHEGIGCNQEECQDCVCALDDLCCTEGWDERCVGEAAIECAPHCPCETTPCCSAHEGLGCAENSCEDCVCSLDSECCTVEWDPRCADEAQAECAARCSCEEVDDCCIERDDPGCSDALCAACVCDVDDVCCSEGWDATCVNIATAECTNDCSCVVQTDCCLRGRTDPGCESEECGECVCGFDDLCCDEVWDDTCVEIASGSGECNSSCKCVCVGDCGNDGTVTIDDLVKAVDIATTGMLPTECVLLDANINGSVTIDELIQAVNFALEGCAP